jgi:hypothetical protein
MKTVIKVSRARWPYKFKAVFPEGKSVSFGRRGYSDYTIHRDYTRMKRYLTRHRKREAWGSAGRYTAGFWSRWLLWSKPNLQAAARATEKVLGTKYKIKLL